MSSNNIASIHYFYDCKKCDRKDIYMMMECPDCEERLGFPPSQQCPKEGCVAMRSLSIGSPYCFPHTVGDLVNRTSQDWAEIFKTLQALIDLKVQPVGKDEV